LLDTTPNTEYNTDMEMTFDTSYIGWILAASFGLFMVYRHIMQRMADMKRAMQQDIRESYDSWKNEVEYTHNRVARMHERLDALEAACACKPQNKEKAPYNSTGYYNAEA
jgi:ABC-type nickel/cobalt efflux system permease component RcnA